LNGKKRFIFVLVLLSMSHRLNTAPPEKKSLFTRGIFFVVNFFFPKREEFKCTTLKEEAYKTFQESRIATGAQNPFKLREFKHSRAESAIARHDSFDLDDLFQAPKTFNTPIKGNPEQILSDINDMSEEDFEAYIQKHQA